MRKLVLASSSKPRKMLLERLLLPFVTVSPNVDETPLENEQPKELVLRLAELKAKTVASQFADALVIGVDQVGVYDSKIVGKPLSIENARKQLQEMSGKSVCFYIGISLIDTKNQTTQTALEQYEVQFRTMTASMIDGYLKKEQPIDCAGSCNADGFGITLIEEFNGKDYTALIGLPLIRLTRMLENFELEVI